MSTIKIDSNGDIALEKNDVVLLTGKDEIAQVLKQELRVFLGEWFLDTREGVPYYQDILKKAPDIGRIDAVLKNRILSSPGIVELLEFQVELNQRNLELVFKARSTEGIIEFNEVLI